MKKKILFVIPSLEIGGAEKSLINLLNEIDYSRYEVDLFLMSKTGLFLKQLPKQVIVLAESEAFKNFSKRFHLSLLRFLKKKEFNLLWNKINFTIANKLINNPVKSEQKNWKYLKHFFPVINKKYDVAIGYLEKNSNYIVADCVIAEKKIGWIHTDLEQLKIDFNLEEKNFEKMDFMVTVSNGLTERLKHLLPNYSNKIVTIENISSKKAIWRQADDLIEEYRNPDFVNIIFVGRLETVKNLDSAIDAIYILLKKNLNVHFHIIGEGSQKEILKQKINNLGISNNIFFYGIKINPYPYIKNADIFILTSNYEGKSISLEEAKILNKPIVITNFSSAKDQIINGITGLIADKNAESIAENIERLIRDDELRKVLIQNLTKMNTSTEHEIEKLYQLIES